ASAPEANTAATSAPRASKPAVDEVDHCSRSSATPATVHVGTPSSTRNHPVKRESSARSSAMSPKNRDHMMAHVSQMTANTGSVPHVVTAWKSATTATKALNHPMPCGSRSKVTSSA